MPDVIFPSRVDRISVVHRYFFGNYPENMDRLVPNSPTIIVHNDQSHSFLFLNRGWLDAVKREAATAPYQPWDTRLSIYNMGLEIVSQALSIANWRSWRNERVPNPPGQQGPSDIAMTWSSVDTQLLNAVCRIPAYLSFDLSFES